MLGIALLFIVLGILVKHRKMYFLIAGYNTMSKKEKGNYNVEGIATVFRNAMFGMAFVIIAGSFIAAFTEHSNIQAYAFWASLMIGIPYLLIDSNSKKYKK